MYDVDGRDRVTELAGVPQSSVGAPNPLVIGDEHRVVLAYYAETAKPGWDGSSVRMVGPSNTSERIAIVRFETCYAHFFGPPNDEAFAGHPLASRGLEPYGVFEVSHSSWIRRLEKMNSVHPYRRLLEKEASRLRLPRLNVRVRVRRLRDPRGTRLDRIGYPGDGEAAGMEIRMMPHQRWRKLTRP